MNKSQVILLAVLVLLIQSSILTVSCRPSDGNRQVATDGDDGEEMPEESMEYTDLTPMEKAGIKKCLADEDLMELCMRCVKATKARNVYPMCCLNEDKVGEWCHDFVYFGIQ